MQDIKERINFRGLPISIENPIGSVRKGVNAKGQPWETRFYYPYGFIDGTQAKDGEEVDCFVGDNPASDMVFIIHQVRADTGYDEDKVMFGFNDAKSAKVAYLAHYDSQGYLGKVTSMPFFEFKEKLKRLGRQGLRIT
jgi:hypothetical protein